MYHGQSNYSDYINGNYSGVPISEVEQTLRAAAYTFTALTGLIGNTIVLIIFYQSPSLRVPVNYHLINIAIVDIITCLSRQIFNIIGVVTNGWPYGKDWCDINGFMQTLCYLLTVMSLLAIAVSRYMVIVHRRSVSHKQVCITIIIIWIYSLVHSLLPIIKWNRYFYHKKEFACVPDYKYELTYPLFCVIADFLIPQIIINYCYLKIYLIARNNSLKVFNKSARLDKIRYNVKLTRNMFYVFLAFLICYIPYSISMLFISPFGIEFPAWYIWFCGWLVNLNSSINPILYYFIFRRFRQLYIAMLCKCNCKIAPEVSLR
ncbi:Tachykinin-like peptides receptor 86C [Trichoplax sp. H2]|uniref:G-protein coupled receptors family 1 profile domain-containing protein n=1 Tax=Trichoplax adhaerens TaxID=10228 RepID=B3S329_TRIAD|nr:hypothetical protein TRIADDRAFT_28334 [Trichoplax adhaerens]EDV22722.1 hypothetical protein TRIADDRAFT_28334 [Trichoplax adhaerens]RDD42728.1 Tachykinin-like peptides receptor 86C [Trichoplax sp. H2]|eukprot:XP_002114588.1 hypothetical protein TRIADDRAFT_28334 [Trichoplax adhaerens]